MGKRLRRARRWRALVAASVLALVAAVAIPQAASANGWGNNSPSPTPTIETVASGLTAPWGIDTGPFGTVFVAESGTGGIVKIWNGAQWTIATTQPGVTDVAFDSWWAVSHVIGAPMEPGGPGNTLGRAFLDGTVVTESDIGAFETANNPDQSQTYGLVDPPAGCDVPEELAAYTGRVDSNAYGLLALDNGLRYVADAAGNDILKVGWNGDLSVVAVLPPIPKTLPAELETDEGSIPLPACLQGATYLAEPVPTAVVQGPDGWLYVSGLTGAPELPGSGVVFRVNPWTGESTVWQDGLTTAVDLAFDNWGRLYVAEVFGGDPAGAPGALKRIDTTWGAWGLVPTGVTTIATGADGVVTPLGVATDDWGSVYVTVNGLPEGDGPPTANGAVLKLTGF
jgi:hypothetical protein